MKKRTIYLALIFVLAYLALIFGLASAAHAVDLRHNLVAPAGIEPNAYACSQARMFAFTTYRGREAGASQDVLLQWIDYHATNYAAAYPDDKEMIEKSRWMKQYVMAAYRSKDTPEEAADKLENNCLLFDGDTDRFVE